MFALAAVPLIEQSVAHTLLHAVDAMLDVRIVCVSAHSLTSSACRATDMTACTQ